MANQEFSRRRFVRHTSLGLALAAAPRWLRAQPQRPATAEVRGATVALRNGEIEAVWEAGANGLRLMSLADPRTGRKLGPAFAPTPVAWFEVGGTSIASTDLTPSHVRSGPLPVNSGAANLAERMPGRELRAEATDPGGRFRLAWRALLRDGSHYIRQEVTLTALGADLPLTQVTLLKMADMGFSVAGSVKGSPLTNGDGWFAGFEHPLSASAAEAGAARAFLDRPLALKAGKSATYSSVIGVAPPGQMRRSFGLYVERERAHPYRPFLHYNSWFDLGYFTPYDQAGCLDVIQAFGEQMHRSRGVRMDSFLFDDGWDNHRDWGFNQGFPHGFAPLKAATAAMGAAPGVWLSPWGGYGNPRKERLANAAAEGFETNRGGLALSGPHYYKLFHQRCLAMVRDYGINQFKLDGTGSTAEVVPGSAFGSDFEAAIQLIADLRQAKPDLFINLTTGTYPSPFWLRHADSTWRGGSDTSFAGAGTDRQQWINYRDGDTFRRVVGRGPLYPLNSLMLHGIVYAKHAKRLDGDPGHDFAAEVRSYFGTGTQLQEMYVSHDLMTSADWDVLADGALWARRNAAALRDSHWVGGDPAQGEPYGHAGWSRDRSAASAVLTLRNPGPAEQTLELDPAVAFELPPDAPEPMTLRSPWKTDQWGNPAGPSPVNLRPGEKHSFKLRPFEVLTLESHG